MCEGDTAATAGAKPFLWHTFLEQTSLHGIGQKYRAFVTACQGGPVAPNQPPPPLPGQSELAEEDKEDLQKTQALLMKLRRDKVRFAALPEVGGASGAEYSRAQLDKIWGELFNGHRFARKKEDVRALVLSAEVFPPQRGQAGYRLRPGGGGCCGHKAHADGHRVHAREALEGRPYPHLRRKEPGGT